MPMNKANYPPDWKEISMRIRQAAMWQCEFCAAENNRPHPETGSRVVLTVAHLDHDTTNNDDSNLRALCQRCHLRYDTQHHMANAARTRRQKRIDAGQMEIEL